jgi:hypothetical protein
MSKITAIVGLLGILLAIVSVFYTVPSLNLAAALVILGAIAGLSYTEDRVLGLLVAVLVYPVVALALVNIPEVGTQLGAIAANIGMLAAGVAVTVLAMRVYTIAKNSVFELIGKSAD